MVSPLRTGRGNQLRRWKGGPSVNSERRTETSLDDIVAGLRPGYLEDRLDDLELVRIFLKRGAFSEILRLGRHLASSGAAYGLPEISEVGRDLADAATSRDEGAVAKSRDRLIRTVTGLIEQVRGSNS